MARPKTPPEELRKHKHNVSLNEEENRDLEKISDLKGLDKAVALRLAWNEFRERNQHLLK